MVLSDFLVPHKFIFGVVCSCLSITSLQAQNSSKVTDLKTEYLINPIGLDTKAPRLTWRLDDSRTGAQQTAYHVMVSTDSAQLQHNNADVWDTQWVNSDKSLLTYNGKSLKPFTKYYWQVQIAGQNKQKSNVSTIASFETGMMDMTNWQGT